MAEDLTYVWRGSKLLPARLGQRCSVVAREKGGTEVVVRFEDGTEVRAPRAAVRLDTSPDSGPRP